MNADKRQALYETLRELDPHPTTELVYTTPFELLIAVLLSAQATDVSVNKAMARMFPVANTPAAVLALGEAGVTEYIKTIGLYRGKARNVIATCEALIAHHGGEVPACREALEALPGVGRKTANVILNTAFGEPVIAVDTHIFRVANRTGLAPGKDVKVVEAALVASTPTEFLHDAHHWLLLHGRYVCKARRPECWHCAIEPLCEFREKTPAPSDEARHEKTVKVANVVKPARRAASKAKAAAGPRAESPAVPAAGPRTESPAVPQTAARSGTTARPAPARRGGAKRTIES